MDKEFKDKLKQESKNNMPDLWDKIENKLEDKKRNNNKIILVAASFAVVITIGIVGSKFLNSYNSKVEYSNNQSTSSQDNGTIQNSEEKNGETQSSEASMVLDVLPDLNLQNILDGKITLNMGLSSAYIAREIDIEKESVAMVYGKVTAVESFLIDDAINSDLSIEVIKDYKGQISAGEVITVGSAGGEMSVEEYKEKTTNPYILNSEGENKKDEGVRVEIGKEKKEESKVINLSKGIPQYRVGEYVLVYLYELDKEGYYSWKDEKYYEPLTADYGIYSSGKFYVDPNTREVYRYVYDYESNNLNKEYVMNLDSLEN